MPCNAHKTHPSKTNKQDKNARRAGRTGSGTAGCLGAHACPRVGTCCLIIVVAAASLPYIPTLLFFSVLHGAFIPHSMLFCIYTCHIHALFFCNSMCVSVLTWRVSSGPNAFPVFSCNALPLHTHTSRLAVPTGSLAVPTGSLHTPGMLFSDGTCPFLHPSYT